MNDLIGTGAIAAALAGLFCLAACQPDGHDPGRGGAGWTDGADPATVGDERADDPILPPPRTREDGQASQPGHR